MNRRLAVAGVLFAFLAGGFILNQMMPPRLTEERLRAAEQIEAAVERAEAALRSYRDEQPEREVVDFDSTP